MDNLLPQLKDRFPETDWSKAEEQQKEIAALHSRLMEAEQMRHVLNLTERAEKAVADTEKLRADTREIKEILSLRAEALTRWEAALVQREEKLRQREVELARWEAKLAQRDVELCLRKEGQKQ